MDPDYNDWSRRLHARGANATFFDQIPRLSFISRSVLYRCVGYHHESDITTRCSNTQVKTNTRNGIISPSSKHQYATSSREHQCLALGCSTNKINPVVTPFDLRWAAPSPIENKGDFKNLCECERLQNNCSFLKQFIRLTMDIT